MFSVICFLYMLFFFSFFFLYMGFLKGKKMCLSPVREWRKTRRRGSWGRYSAVLDSKALRPFPEDLRIRRAVPSDQSRDSFLACLEDKNVKRQQFTRQKFLTAKLAVKFWHFRYIKMKVWRANSFKWSAIFVHEFYYWVWFQKVLP